VLELQDSQSGETLARAVDRRAADPVDDAGTYVSRVTSVTAWTEVRGLGGIAPGWASTVTRRPAAHLGPHAGPGPCQPLQ
jgi:hypothetical protein